MLDDKTVRGSNFTCFHAGPKEGRAQFHLELPHVLMPARGASCSCGALLTGDILQVVADRMHVSFMHGYPNYIPLPASAIERIAQAVEPFAFDRVCGPSGMWGSSGTTSRSSGNRRNAICERLEVEPRKCDHRVAS